MITYLVDERRKEHVQNPYQAVNKISIILNRTSGLQIWDLFYFWFLNNNVENSSLSALSSLFINWNTVATKGEDDIET